MKEPRVYKTSPVLLVFIVILFLFFMGILLFAFGPNLVGFMIPVAILALLLFGFIFVALVSKTLVSEDEIEIQGLLGSKTLKWTEIGRASGWGYTMRLHSRDEDVTVKVSPQLPGYEQVIDFIGTKRPDLFSPQEYGEMKRGLGPFISMFFVVFVLVVGSVVFILTTMNDPNVSLPSYMPLLVFMGIAFVMVAATLSIPRSLTLEGRTMTLKYLLKDKVINVDEISNIQFSYTQSRNGKHYFIALHMTNRKSIRLSGLGISLPVAYLVLKNWHRGYSGGMRQSVDIAPNWADNTWK